MTYSLNRIAPAGFRYTTSLQFINGVHVWVVKARDENDFWFKRDFPQHTLSDDGKTFTVSLLTEDDLNHAQGFLHECRSSVENVDDMHLKIEQARDVMRAPLVMPLIAIAQAAQEDAPTPVQLLLNGISAIFGMIRDYAATYIPVSVTDMTMIRAFTVAPWQARVRLTNQQRLEAILAHPKFNEWDGRDAFNDKVDSWRDCVTFDLLEDPINLNPTMSRSTYEFAKLTRGTNPQAPDTQLPFSCESNHALKAEIEATLSDCENALRRLSLQLRN